MEEEEEEMMWAEASRVGKEKMIEEGEEEEEVRVKKTDKHGEKRRWRW